MKTETIKRIKDLATIATGSECTKVDIHGDNQISTYHEQGIRQWKSAEELTRAAQRTEKEI